MHKVERAIIMAAGIGEADAAGHLIHARKPMVKVNGVRMIDTSYSRAASKWYI